MNKNEFKSWEYSKIGNYHKNLDPNWSYTPTYLKKMYYIKKYIASFSKEEKILDAGCGEGVLIEELSNQGYNIEGIDLNYSNSFIKLGDIKDMSFYKSDYFGLVLLLDVLEHIAFKQQSIVLKEISRVLKPGGILLAAIPNMAHLNSRFQFGFLGKIDRTDIEINHVGERPLTENVKLIKDAGFKIEKIIGVTITVPLIYRSVICKRPAKFKWLHDILDLFSLPSLSMLNLFWCRK